MLQILHYLTHLCICAWSLTNNNLRSLFHSEVPTKQIWITMLYFRNKINLKGSVSLLCSTSNKANTLTINTYIACTPSFHPFTVTSFSTGGKVAPFLSHKDFVQSHLVRGCNEVGFWIKSRDIWEDFSITRSKAKLVVDAMNVPLLHM